MKLLQTNNSYVLNVEILESYKSLYSKLVVQDLETQEFFILTVFPNWQETIPAKGDIGYIEFEYCEAGITKYYNKNSENFNKYLNTYFVFKQFIKSTPQINQDIQL